MERPAASFLRWLVAALAVATVGLGWLAIGSADPHGSGLPIIVAGAAVATAGLVAAVYGELRDRRMLTGCGLVLTAVSPTAFFYPLNALLAVAGLGVIVGELRRRRASRTSRT